MAWTPKEPRHDHRAIAPDPERPGVVPTPVPLPGPPGGHGGRVPGDPGLGPGAEGGRLPGVPLRRLPAGDLGDLPDPPELRGVHPRRPDLRRDHRVHGLADRDGPRGGAALRLARPRVRQAHLRGLLDDGPARGASPLPLDHALSPVLGLHERDLRADHVAVRRPLLPRDLHRVPLVLRLELALGAAEGAPRRDRRALEPPRHRDPVRVELLGHVHDLARRRQRRRPVHGNPLAGRQQLHVDAGQHPPADRQRHLRRHDRRRLRGLPVPRRQDRRGPSPLRLDGVHRELRGALGADGPAVRRVLARVRDLRIQPDHGHHDDGRLHVVALDRPGHSHRGAVPGLELLPLAGDGAHPRRRALPALDQVPPPRDRARIHGLGHAAEPDRLPRRGPRDGRLGPPLPPVLRRHVGEEHRREPDDPDDVPLVSPLPTGQQAAHGVLGPDGDGPPVAHLRPRRRGGRRARGRGLLRRGHRPHPALLPPPGRARSSCAS